MGKNVGIKDHENKSDKTGRIAKPLPRCQKHQKAQSQRKQLRARPHFEDELVSVSVVTRQPVTAIQIRFRFEKRVIPRWRNPQMIRKNGHGREKLHQRRVFRVQPIISRFPHHVAGEHVVVFIKGERFPMHDDQRQGCLNHQESRHHEPQVFSAMPCRRPIFLFARRPIFLLGYGPILIFAHRPIVEIAHGPKGRRPVAPQNCGAAAGNAADWMPSHTALFTARFPAPSSVTVHTVS